MRTCFSAEIQREPVAILSNNDGCVISRVMKESGGIGMERPLSNKRNCKTVWCAIIFVKLCLVWWFEQSSNEDWSSLHQIRDSVVTWGGILEFWWTF
jgi:hypothetical protein